MRGREREKEKYNSIEREYINTNNIENLFNIYFCY